MRRMARPLTRPRSPTRTRRRRSLASRRSRLSPVSPVSADQAQQAEGHDLQAAGSGRAFRRCGEDAREDRFHDRCHRDCRPLRGKRQSINLSPVPSAFDSPCRWHIGVDGQHRPPLPCHFHSSLPPASPSPMFRPSPSCPPGLSVVLCHSTNQSSRVNRASSHPCRRVPFPPRPFPPRLFSLHSFPPSPSPPSSSYLVHRYITGSNSRYSQLHVRNDRFWALKRPFRTGNTR